jgi:hypothetical protein
MKRFVGIVKACALLDVLLVAAWLITLFVNPPLGAHIAMCVLGGAAAILAGALLTAPIWLPLGVLIMALATGNSIIGFVSNHVPEAVGKLFGGAQ